MGIYQNYFVLFGCPITPSKDKLVEKLQTVKDNISSISSDDNYLIGKDAIFLVVPRTKREISCAFDANDIANGYVKMSELESIAKIKKEDLTPTEEEIELFTKYINALVKDDKKDEMNNKIKHYMVEF